MRTNELLRLSAYGKPFENEHKKLFEFHKKLTLMFNLKAESK